MAAEDNNGENGSVVETGTNTPGTRLKEERKHRGLSLAQVASEMHMDVGVADALEKDDYSPLGAPIFVKGHLRNYAKLLGLPADELINEYEQMAAPQTPELMTNHPTVGSMGQAGVNGNAWFTGIGIVLVIVLLGGLVFWVYSQRQADDGVFSDITLQDKAPSARMPEGKVADEPAFNGRPEDIDPLLPQKPDTKISVNSNSPALDTDLAANEDKSEIDVGRETASLAAVSEAPVKKESVVEPVTMELTFNEDSWVEVYATDDRPLLYELGRAGQVRQLQIKPPVRVFLGNAPAVDITVNSVPFDMSAFLHADSTARFTIKK